MGLLFPQSASGEVISIPAGTHTGHVRLTKHDVTFRGEGRGVSILKGDGTLTSMFQGTFDGGTGLTSTPDGRAVRSIIVEDLTLDCDAIGTITAALAGNQFAGPLNLIAKNVDIIDTHRNTVGISASANVEARGVTVVGGGGGFQASSGCTGFTMNDCAIRGGAFGFVCSHGEDFEIPGIKINGFEIDHGYWASPTYEAVTATAFAAQYVDVESNVTAARSLYDVIRVLVPIGQYDGDLPAEAIEWDRLENEDGEWAEVISTDGVLSVGTWHAVNSWREIDEPGGTATVYRQTLGRLYGWSSTRLSLVTGQGAPAAAHWRHPNGDIADTPVVDEIQRVDVIRHGDQGGMTRDVDSGGIHITRTGVGAWLRGVNVKRGFSDMFSTRAEGVFAEDCTVSDGQDMGFTVDGTHAPQLLRRCVARRAGFFGFWMGGGPSRLERCEAYDNGIHHNGISGIGVYAEEAAADSYVEMSGSGHDIGLSSGVTLSTPRPLPSRRTRWRRDRRWWQ